MASFDYSGVADLYDSFCVFDQDVPFFVGLARDARSIPLDDAFDLVLPPFQGFSDWWAVRGIEQPGHGLGSEQARLTLRARSRMPVRITPVMMRPQPGADACGAF